MLYISKLITTMDNISFCLLLSPDMENEEVEEAFVTSIAQADRPLCTHQLSAILFTSWAHDAPGRRFWRCKNWKVGLAFILDLAKFFSFPGNELFVLFVEGGRL